MRRSLPYLFLLAFVFLLFAPALFRREVFVFRDHFDYFEPLRWFTASSLRAGQLPLWNPYNASGEPWLANPQTGVFYPPAWLFLVLPFATAYMLFLALHLGLLACGAYLLFAQRNSPGAALIGATALAFCGPTLSLVDVQNNLTTFAWLPLVIWCGLTRASKMWSAAAIAMSFLAGEPFFAAAGALIFAVVRRRDLFDVAAQSFSLAGVQLIPFLALVRGSDRTSSGMSAALITHESMPLLDWLRLAVPPSLTASGFDPKLGQHFIPVVYIGVLTCALAVAGAIAARRRALGWLVLLAAAIVLGAGSYLTPVDALLTKLPLTLFRYPARLVPAGALALTALAAEGWDAVAHLVRLRWLSVVVAVVLFLELTSVARPLLVSAKFDPHVVPYDRGIGRDAKIVRYESEMRMSPHRAAWISGYLNLYDRRFDLLTAAPLASQRYMALYERATSPGGVPLLNAMSGGYVLSAQPQPLPQLAVVSGVHAYRNPGALPLAYARGESGHLFAPSLLAFGTTFVHGSISVPEPSMMIVTQQRAAGWSVRVDGERAKMENEGDFLAVKLARGRHDVIWRYRSIPLIAGAILTLLAIARMLLPRSFVKR